MNYNEMNSYNRVINKVHLRGKYNEIWKKRLDEL